MKRKSPLFKWYEYVFLGAYAPDDFILKNAWSDWMPNEDEIREQLFAESIGLVEGEK